MSIRPRDIVRAGYDAAAPAYAEARSPRGPEQPWLGKLIAAMERGSAALDLGCGNGVPIARALVDAGLSLTGVNFSVEQIRRARLCVPEATFLATDMAQLDLGDAKFDGAVAWDSAFHLPPTEHPAWFRRVHGWLNPGAPFLLTLGGTAGELHAEHLGHPMYYGAMAPDMALRELAAAGFSIVEHEIDDPRGQGHIVVFARRDARSRAVGKECANE